MGRIIEGTKVRGYGGARIPQVHPSMACRLFSCPRTPAPPYLRIILFLLFSYLLPLTSHLSFAGNLLTDRYNLTSLDLSNGLPHNHVSDIFMDSNGFLWICTYGGGLVRYDGYGVMEPQLDLNSKSCRSITEDHFHRLWVAFDEGINIIDLKTMKAVMPDHPELQKLLVLPSIRCYCDALGRI